jgi:hypothetical protein
MKSEIIVAKIEEYINSLSDADKEAYDNIMTLKEKHPEESVSTFTDVLKIPILNLALIVDELKQEIKKTTIKQNKGSSTLQRIKKINKYLNKNDERMKKAWVENKKMCITNGFTAFIFNEILEGVEINNTPSINLHKCFPDENDYRVVSVDIVDIKYRLKLHKSKETGKKKKTTCHYIIDGHHFNAQYLIDAYKILGGKIVFKQNDNVLSPAIIESENGKSIVLPIRPTKENK